MCLNIFPRCSMLKSSNPRGESQPEHICNQPVVLWVELCVHKCLVPYEGLYFNVLHYRVGEDIPPKAKQQSCGLRSSHHQKTTLDLLVYVCVQFLRGVSAVFGHVFLCDLEYKMPTYLHAVQVSWITVSLDIKYFKSSVEIWE